MHEIPTFSCFTALKSYNFGIDVVIKNDYPEALYRKGPLDTFIKIVMTCEQ